MTNSPEFPDSSVVKECLTTDLVMRLRSENSMPPYYGVPKLQVEAAAEIERLRIENIQMKFALGYPMPADLEQYILPSNPFKCGTCGARAALAQGGDK